MYYTYLLGMHCAWTNWCEGNWVLFLSLAAASYSTYREVQHVIRLLIFELEFVVLN